MNAIYPGTFDPITYGHLDLIERAAKLFDNIVIAVGVNPQKLSLFSPEERVEMIQKSTEAYTNLEVTQYEGLTVHFAKKRNINLIIRSLRSTSEYELEHAYAISNRELNPDLETFFMMSSLQYNYLSSTIVREIAQFGGDLTPFVPPIVQQGLEGKFSGTS